jgi:hypothetical protein
VSRGWFANNNERAFSGQPHNLHDLRQLELGGAAWTCRCRATGTAPTADDAVEAHRAHVAKATPGLAVTP